MSTLQNIRAAIKRKLSIHDKNPDLDAEDVDEETTGHLHREIESAMEEDKDPHGRPGSFLNRLILHGNKKTEDQLARDAEAARKREQEAAAARTQQ